MLIIIWNILLKIIGYKPKPESEKMLKKANKLTNKQKKNAIKKWLERNS